MARGHPVGHAAHCGSATVWDVRPPRQPRQLGITFSTVVHGRELDPAALLGDWQGRVPSWRLPWEDAYTPRN